MVKRLSLMVSAAMVFALTLAASALAQTPDPVLVNAKDSVTDYFTDNLGTVIAAFVAIALAIWLLRMLFRSVGIGRPRGVN